MDEILYKNKYRIPASRLRGYDYGANGCYYVTICTKNREHFFGEIVVADTVVETDNYPSLQSKIQQSIQTDNDPSLQSTEIGKIAKQYWLNIPNHFPFIALDEFVIMPNHIHGILFFDKQNVETDNYPSLSKIQQQKQTDNYPSLQWQPNKFGRQSQNLGSVIRGFKSSLKRYANENEIDFAWQERFYDTIIRNDKALNNVRNYIFDNPKNWLNDELYGNL